MTILRDVSSTYRDGAEESLLHIIGSADDVSSLSEDLHRSASTWAERYHLDRTRANVLRAFDLPVDARVLEVGAGCGAISRYLAETCSTVDALEPVPSRAEVAARRLRDLEGARVFVGQVDDLPDEPSYDVIVVIGVLEYVGGGTADRAPYLTFLNSLRRRLVPGGTIVLAIENKLGVKYLAGAPEDHSDRAFDSVEGYPIDSPARTFDRRDLIQLFADAGLSDSRVYGAFPDYKLTRVVHADELADDPLVARLPRFPSPDWQTARDFGPNEELLWRSLVEAGQGAVHSNSFVVVATETPEGKAALWPHERRAVFFTTERRPGLATRSVVTEVDGQLELARRTVGRLVHSSGSLVHRTTSGPILEGVGLIEYLARASPEEARPMLIRWMDMVRESATDSDGVALDLVPHNLLVTAQGDESFELTFIDDEWRSHEWSADDVVARGLIWTCERLSTVPSRWRDRVDRRALLDELAELSGFLPEGDWVTRAVDREAVFQTTVSRLPSDSPSFPHEVAHTRAELNGLLALPMSPARPKLSGLVDDRNNLYAGLQVSLARAADLEGQLAAQREQIETATRQAGSARDDASRAQAELAALRSSTAHQVGERYRRVLDRIAPPTTGRRRLYQSMGAVVRRRV